MGLIPITMAVLTVLSLNPVSSNERAHPFRDITLEAYKNPTTFVGSDGSQIANSLRKEYFKTLGKDGTTFNSTNVIQDILVAANGTENIMTYREKFIISADFSENTGLSIPLGPFTIPVPGTQLTALYNSVPLHARPLAQLHTSNTLLRHLEANSNSKHSISLATHPIPRPRTSQFEAVANDGIDMLTYAFGITLPMGLAILVSSFLIFPLSERATNAKQVQIMTGLHPVTFWTSNLLWDLFLFLVPAVIMLVMIMVLDENETFLTNGAWAALLFMIVLLGLFGTPFAYVFSFLANNAASGFAFLIIFNILSGCIAPTAVFMLRTFGGQFESDTLLEVSDAVR